MLRELLENALDDGAPIPRDLLNCGLHAALCLDRPEAAAMLLAAGADTSLYNRDLESAAGRVNDVADARPFESTLDSKTAWTEVVRAAAADSGAPYLTNLIDQAQQSSGGYRGAAWRACESVLGTTKLGAVDGVSVDAELFMLLLLANRPGLARLLWLRDSQEREDHALRSALVACALCSRLAQLPEVLDHCHALDTLRQV
jgi:hypothetical protein